MNRLQSKTRRLVAHVAVVASTTMALLSVGCQVAGNAGLSSSQSKSIAQIAEESMQAAQSDSSDINPDQFTTMESSIEELGSNRRDQIRPVPRTRRASSRKRGNGSGTFIDEIFDQTDVREALQAISSQANVPIIVDDQVAGNITALIQNEPLDQALRKVLLPLGLHYRVVDGEYLVCSSDPTSPMFSIISERLDYAPIHTAPTELVELLSEKNRQFVRIAPKRNMLIIEAPSEIARQIVDEMQRFDQPVPQVVLEAMVVVVSPDSGFQFGSNMRQGVGSTVENGDDVNIAIDGLALSGNLSGAVVSNLFRRFSVTSFFIRALEQEGYLTIRATPHVMAKHGEKAEISIARETFFSTQPANADQFFRQDIQKVEAGISLIITPTIRGDNVTMLIEKAEVSEDIRATVSDPAVNNPFPLINRRQVSTTVNVKDGETIVIGGLMQNQLVDRISSVPVLGNIPVIGRFFTQITQEEQAAEVVVFISPRVVRHSSEHPMAGAEQSANACGEFIHSRRFPRNNGLELGGPMVGPQQSGQQFYESAWEGENYEQPENYEAGSYETGNNETGTYESSIPPAPMVAPVSSNHQQRSSTHQEFQRAVKSSSPQIAESISAPSGRRASTPPAQNQQVSSRMRRRPGAKNDVVLLTADPLSRKRRQHSSQRQKAEKVANLHRNAPQQANIRPNAHVRKRTANNPLRDAHNPNSDAVINLRDTDVRKVGYEQTIRN